MPAASFGGRSRFAQSSLGFVSASGWRPTTSRMLAFLLTSLHCITSTCTSQWASNTFSARSSHSACQRHPEYSQKGLSGLCSRESLSAQGQSNNPELHGHQPPGQASSENVSPAAALRAPGCHHSSPPLCQAKGETLAAVVPQELQASRDSQSKHLLVPQEVLKTHVVDLPSEHAGGNTFLAPFTMNTSLWG